VGGLRPAVAVMAKVPGAVPAKSRLHSALSPAAATDLYRCFLLDRLDGVAALPGVTPVLAFTPTDARATAAALAPPAFRLLAQEGEDLGTRLVRIFDRLFTEGHRSVIVLDSDSPTLPMTYVVDAVETLETMAADVVLGPCDDGGYYLVGLTTRAPSLFERVPWSTSDVFAITRDRAAALGLRARFLPTWFDVDTGADLERLRRSLERGEDCPSRTRAFLELLPC
jgi:rSAM/selenodomain-associated transferase 1